MKRVHSNQLAACLIALSMLVVVNLTAGCEDKQEDGGTGPGSGPISVDGIIANPKAALLQDTLRASAIVTGSSAPGDYAKYVWTATGGSFIEDDQSVVRWVAPGTEGTQDITVAVSNSVSNDSYTSTLYVGNVQTFIGGQGGGLYLSTTGDSLIYYYSPVPPSHGGFKGWGIRVFSGTIQTAFDHNRGVKNLTLAPRFTHAAFNNAMPGLGGLQSMYFQNLVTGVETQIPPRPYLPFITRAPVYKSPAFSPDGSVLAYEAMLPDTLPVAEGGVDTLLVHIYDIAAAKEKRVVTIGNNLQPTFSTDGNWLTFLSNRTSEWEYHAVAVNGTSVDTDSVQGSIQLTNTGGVMGPGLLKKAWSPTQPVLATTGNTGTLWLVQTDGSGATEVAASGSVLEFRWAPDGQSLVMSTGAALWHVDNAGVATLLLQAPTGDRYSRASISADNNFVLFSVARSGQTWYRILDLSGAAGLAEPLDVTAAEVTGRAGEYEPFFPLAPVWLPNEPRARMLLFGTRNTPKVCTMTFSSLLP